MTTNCHHQHRTGRNKMTRCSIGVLDSWPLASWRQIGCFCVLLSVLTCSLLVYYASSNDYSLSAPAAFTSRYSLEQMKEFAFKNSILTDYKPSYYSRRNLSFNRIFEDPKNRFNIADNDVIVFLHIQKTAGTSFEKFLVRNLDLVQPCTCVASRKRCKCHRPGSRSEYWLFSRYSTGWMCGLHADYTELAVSGCVDNALDKKEDSHRKRRYFYTTFLREPVGRFISEYRHVERGATWLASRHMCNGRPPGPDQLPLCFDPEAGWGGVSLDEFLGCPYNLAFNRQTRMLADLTLVNCYDTKSMDAETRQRIMLESAKRNLKAMAFFGLKERMLESQWMFEQSFDLKFTKRLADWSKSKSNGTEISEAQMAMIRKHNELDLELYDYAVTLFDKRMEKLKQTAGVPDEAELERRESVAFDTELDELFNDTPLADDSQSD